MPAAYLVDVFSLMFQVFHAIPPMTGPSGQPTNAVFGFSRDLLGLIKDHQPEYLIAAMDVSGPAVRAEWYPEYKANRTEMPADLQPQVPILAEVLDAFGLPVVRCPGWEADDIIATLTTQLVGRGSEVRIVTTDKDARQLLCSQVKLLNLRKKFYLDEAALAADWGIRPDQVIDFQSLVGDAVDNVPGVPLIGPKKAAQLLNEFGTLDEVLANADKAPGAKLKENLKTFADQARLSKRLVTLYRDLPLEVDWDAWKAKRPDVPRLQELFRQLGFRRLVDEVRVLGPAASVTRPAASPKKLAARGLFDDEPDESLVSDQLLAQAELGTTSTNITAESPDNQGLPGPLPVGTLTRIERTWKVIDTLPAFEEFCQEFSKQSAYCLDLETTGVDPIRAAIVGWAFCWTPGEGYYLPVQGPVGETLLSKSLVVDTLRPLLADPARRMLNQNIKYDLIVLWQHDVFPGAIGFDPMVADYLLDAGARGHNLGAIAAKHLHAETIPISQLIGTGKNQKSMADIPIAQIAEYATEDADLVIRLEQTLRPQLASAGLEKLYNDLEQPLIPILAEMEHWGIKVDTAELARQSSELNETLEGLISQIHQEAGREFNIDSPLQLRKILFDELKLPVFKKTKTGPSTDQEVLEQLAPLHQLPALITQHRHLSKLKGTYLDALPELVNPNTGRIHASFNQTVAATGRLSSSDPNLQNIPIRTPEGSRIRKAFIPQDDNWLLVCADYSQIELRVLAHFSQDAAMLSAFANGVDIHSAVAATVNGVDVADVTSDMRRVAKAVNFGIIYGQSPFGLAQALGISRDEATRFIDDYFARYSGVTQFMEGVLDETLKSGYARTILGRRRPIEGIRPAGLRPQQRNMPERTAINTVIQGSAADLIKQAMLGVTAAIKSAGLQSRLLLQIHDELVFECPKTEVTLLLPIVRQQMETALPLDVPLAVDVSTGPNWLETKTA